VDPTTAIVLAIIALLIGLALGWYFGSRPAAKHEAAAKEREGQVKQAAKELHDTQIEMERLKGRAENFDEQIRQLNEARDAMLAQFKVTGGEVLSKAQDEFIKRAEEKFGHAEKTSKEAVAALLEPVNQRLQKYETQVETLERQRIDAFAGLRTQIEEMQKGQEAVRTAALQLGNSLRNAPKARGRWGEQQLKNVLEQCGLAEHTDFVTEQSVDTDEGRLRPDAIVRIPGNKLLVIDAKVSLNAYQDAFEANDEVERARHLDLHTASMRNHIQTLGAKSYQSQFEEAPDYVLMFVPGEHFIAAALEHDPRLWDFAFERRVLLASPTNLVAICRTVAQVWRQDGLAREAREIGRMGGELYDRLAKVTEDLGKVGTHLGRAVGSYNDFARSFQSRVVVSAKRLRDKHIEIGKREIDDVPLVEGAPRYGSDDEARLLGDAANDAQEAAE
jgi:DNA recombination protein RmuC